ncbi:hypothetical protein PPL_06372 [Heterostelium album PN500]|uniref:Uncharacterized protein n=1 Tax=Heterostelium pallidum (strain ATCC 26659 / Pp 5 / PN500) TaxID=670386 RepID=D3BCZ4_HETP5|nr:hypothetical protein PPL_06372 [Heterostelium album PN500]EFA80786.1 hypothetical protein PPL_06372 [Heterostelium album PN500]|eukprot:XP_020432905.1 hypothetical protein PPL_06372 [Heterostelium album PN500]
MSDTTKQRLKKDNNTTTLENKKKDDKNSNNNSGSNSSELLLLPCYTCFFVNLIGGIAWAIFLPAEDLITLKAIGVAVLQSVIYLLATIIIAIPDMLKRPFYLRSKNRKIKEHDVLLLDYFIFGIPSSVASFLVGSSIIHFASLLYRVISFVESQNQDGVSLDIHLQLDANTYQLVMGYNKEIREMAPNDQIDLGVTSLPHITLYLTQFLETEIGSIVNDINAIFEQIQQKALNCKINCIETVVIGQYGMWNVEVNPCLQYISDLIVNTTCKYIVPNQPIPSWVYELPEPVRTEKIDMITKYGSPNVFSQFQPHITLAWDDIDNLNQTFATLNIPPTAFISPSMGIGDVGDYGTSFWFGLVGLWYESELSSNYLKRRLVLLAYREYCINELNFILQKKEL